MHITITKDVTGNFGGFADRLVSSYLESGAHWASTYHLLPFATQLTTPEMASEGVGGQVTSLKKACQNPSTTEQDRLNKFLHRSLAPLASNYVNFEASAIAFRSATASDAIASLSI